MVGQLGLEDRYRRLSASGESLVKPAGLIDLEIFRRS